MTSDEYSEVMEEVIEEGYFNPINEALREATKGEDRDPEKVYTVVRTTEPYKKPAGEFQTIPEGSFVIGEAYLSEYLPGEDLVRDYWEQGVAPLYAEVGPDEAAIGTDVPVAMNPTAIVSGEWFGKDDTVALVTITTTLVDGDSAEDVEIDPEEGLDR